jgi:NAD(P)-dependent dehydrogenase (short-subunit alcohol dehydrogenase family)
MSLPIAVVTGANSGIGRATAIHLAANGYRVFATVRSLGKAGKLISMAQDHGVSVELIELDIASDESVHKGFAQILDQVGHVDLLVNNAGVGGNAVTEECPTSLYLEVLNINVCGAVRCAQAVLPGMRAQGSGCIVNVTSVVGKVAALGQSPYFTSKWGLEGLSEGLAQEVAPFGIRVAIVEPGVTKSAIFAKNIDAPNQSGAYDSHYRRLFQLYAVGLANATDPFEVGAVILHAATTDRPLLRYPCSWGAVELIQGRDEMTDEIWVELGSIVDDQEYYDKFQSYFGLDLH